MRRARCAVAVVFAVASFVGRAHATDPERVVWSPDWPRVGWVEGVSAFALTGVAIGMELGIQPPEHARWRGGVLFDDWVRDGLRAKTGRARATWTDVGNTLYLGVAPAVVIADVAIVALAVHGSGDVAGQMALIDLQALGTAGVLAVGTEHLVGRARPETEECPSSEPDCRGRGGNMSFMAGHPAAVATMAGLTCAHHQHLPLYGGGVADLAPCVLLIGAAGVTGVARVAGDKHWASDVVVGWTVGALTGYIVPSLLHYGFTSGRPVGELSTGSLTAVPVPQVYPGGGGLGWVGLF